MSTENSSLTSSLIEGVTSGRLTGFSVSGDRFSIRMTTSKPQRRYSVGDVRKVGKRTLIKQLKIGYDPIYGITGYSRRGKSLTEWVEKDSIYDQDSPNYVDPRTRYFNNRYPTIPAKCP